MDPKRFISLSFFSILLVVQAAPFHDTSFPAIAMSYGGDVDVAGASYSCRLSAMGCSPVPSPRVFNVEDFGAVGDGITDDSKAFGEAWKEACSSSSSSLALFLVPDGKNYLLKPIAFSGPCKSRITVMIRGTLEASSTRSDWNVRTSSYIRHWILFTGIGNLVVQGGGTLNGKGQVWWENSCKRNPSLPCVNAPTALYFAACKNLRVNNLIIRDSQQIHLWFDQCRNVQTQALTITAPEASPNTDGIHVSGSKNVLINDTFIATGDDCVSIVSGSRGVITSNIVCGPGHGISIGSLGANSSMARVSNVIVDRVTLKGTTNGVRIKTWQGGHGHAKQIIFQNIVMNGVQNPIIIDQNYCDSRTPCQEQISAVSVNHVVYRNIKGTSASEYAMRFNCSRSMPCRNIVLQNINLVRENGGPAESFCNNLQWTQSGTTSPTPCT